MTKIDENIQTAQNMLSGMVEKCYKLEEENKKLKKENGNLKEELFNIKRNTKYNWLRDTLVIDDSKTAIEQGARAYEAELHNRYVSELEEENKTLKDNVEFLHSCLDDRDKSIAILQEENKKLNEEIENLKDAMKELNNYNKFRIQENERLREELNKKGMETWFDEKAENIYISQKENILMGKIC